ncbi:MAG: sigma-70 family RNA polymerase sigma factor [Gammaproteobacteria bacterium]|nr:sigma-70 family RNA polymerase sigma factor [Gammaproteobacteria bacterium]
MTDEELMNAVSNGEHAAYQQLVKTHLPSISKYAYRIMGNQSDTNDITQETFIRLWVNAERWDPKKSKLTTWLHRIAHNLCIDHLRKCRKNKLSENFEEDIADQELTRDNEIESNELNDKIQDLLIALRTLPESQRSALALCHYSGFSNKEAASIMNISVKALESAISRAKRSLRKTLMNAPSNEHDKA